MQCSILADLADEMNYSSNYGYLVLLSPMNEDPSPLKHSYVRPLRQQADIEFVGVSQNDQETRLVCISL